MWQKKDLCAEPVRVLLLDNLIILEEKFYSNISQIIWDENICEIRRQCID